jgi:hypothetical protein
MCDFIKIIKDDSKLALIEVKVEVKVLIEDKIKKDNYPELFFSSGPVSVQGRTMTHSYYCPSGTVVRSIIG